MSNRVFEYTERSDDSYKKRIENGNVRKRDSIFVSGFTGFKPRQGTNKVRILPPTWEKPEHYGYDVWVHFNVGPNNSSYLCLNRMKGEKCPICEELAKTNDKKIIDNLKAKRQVLVWVIDRMDEENSPKLWAMPPSMDKNFLMQASDPDTGELLKIDHPVDGYDVVFTRNGEKLSTKYEGEQIARKTSSIANTQEVFDKYLNSIVEKPVPSIIVYKDYEYIKNVFNGMVGEPVGSPSSSLDEVKEETTDIEEDQREVFRKQFREKLGNG